ncbi:MAG: hypothetical protein ACD_52C00065G0001 [uncultured bacterium]|nr:MAG: hypothetical protein ACD_52C00065G0001 [uncultured bacterium]
MKEKGLVRNLVSAETLGGVTTICVDKTGTLTYGKLEVVEEIGNIEDVCVQHFASTDDPIMVAARDWLSEHSVHFKTTETQFNGDCVMIDSIPFIPQNRYYASLIEHKNKQKEIYVNGAPETLMDWSTLTKIERGQVEAKIRSFTKEGKRVIAMAKKAAPTQMTKISEQEINGLKWVGLLVFMDSVRVGVRDSFDQAKKSGIKTIVITGDYAATAVAVMSEIGMEMSKERIILGDDLEKMTVLEVSKRLANLYKAGNKPILFARTLPEQKLKVITALKKNNEVVAMMGDGVNDAPAIHRADIGIVVGDATDVARESADLVLLDSSFKTIIDAIKEGRAIFDNIRKIVLYLLSDSFEEIVTVAGTIVLGVILLEKVPLPVTAAQILWINLVSDGFPHLALTVDPKREDIMNEPPRNPKEILVSGWMRKLIFIVSLSGGIIALVLFMYFYKTTGDIVFSRSIAFAALGVNSLVYVFSVRTLKAPFWKQNPFENKWLNLAVFLGLAFQVVPFFFAGTRAFLLLTPLQPAHWAVVFGSAGAMFVLIEVAKVRLIKD